MLLLNKTIGNLQKWPPWVHGGGSFWFWFCGSVEANSQLRLCQTNNQKWDVEKWSWCRSNWTAKLGGWQINHTLHIAHCFQSNTDCVVIATRTFFQNYSTFLGCPNMFVCFYWSCFICLSPHGWGHYHRVSTSSNGVIPTHPPSLRIFFGTPTHTHNEYSYSWIPTSKYV